jgi:hypothetical protein
MDRDLPENLIDFLLIKKKCNYLNEARLKLLRKNEQADWDRLDKDWDSSEEEVDDAVNNFIWYRGDQDPDNYFTMMTRHNDFIEKDCQVLCCYGRRSNTYLMPAYGFCLQNNKYNSLRFKVWVDFSNETKTETPEPEGKPY